MCETARIRKINKHMNKDKLTSLLGLFLLCSLLLPCPSNKSYAQEIVEFTEGLAVPFSHSYTRSAIYTDHVVYNWVHDHWETPQEGGVVAVTPDGDTLRWQRITVNNQGRFQGRAMMSGYLYLSHYSDTEKVMWLHARGHNMSFVNGEPRGGDLYGYNYVYQPVEIKQGLNHILLRSARWGGISARLLPAQEGLVFLEGDDTLPHILTNDTEALWGAVRLINSTNEVIRGAQIRSSRSGQTMVTDVPDIAPMTMYKARFQFMPGENSTTGRVDIPLELMSNGNILSEINLQTDVLRPDQHYSRTFVSYIDGSVQYYSVAPAQDQTLENPALFLSTHGAEVEAINQARAYRPKDWGVLVAPTNRRPRGFNWEDWGRKDALEVLSIAKETFRPDPSRIYLTGHSMGGHGAWYLGATYPGNWAAIAPAAGYPTLRTYGSHDGVIPVPDNPWSAEGRLYRASNASDVMSLIPNYEHLGVYILHGDADRTVSVEHARTMRSELGQFHADFVHYEYPGGSHWYGNHSVDWPPIFEFFRDRTITPSEEKDHIHFITASPGVSDSFKWGSVVQQRVPLEMSRFDLHRDKEAATISGTTENIRRLKLDLSVFSVGSLVSIHLDDLNELNVQVPSGHSVSLVRSRTAWQPAEELRPDEKGPHRYGPFKEAFSHNMLFVYGTLGSDEENRELYNKVRYDAETWYYRGNGSVDIIPDSEFHASRYPDCSVILYGNSEVNSAWSTLLPQSPVQVDRSGIRVGNFVAEGGDLAIYFTYPRFDSDIASVGVVAGTGVKGIRSAIGNQYFAGGSGFSDYMIFGSDKLRYGAEKLLEANFFDHQWAP